MCYYICDINGINGLEKKSRHLIIFFFFFLFEVFDNHDSKEREREYLIQGGANTHLSIPTGVIITVNLYYVMLCFPPLPQILLSSLYSILFFLLSLFNKILKLILDTF
jgi:hypothetical protein